MQPGRTENNVAHSAGAVAAVISKCSTAVQRRWQRVDFDEEAFAEIAFETLNELRPAAELRPMDIVEWVVGADFLPYQDKLDESFGQPPVTLFWNGRFMVEALFWHTGTTGIHQHAFSGAFAVLGGSSVHCRYRFELEERISSRFLLGRTRIEEIELLGSGDVRRIDRGAGLVHSLFHMDNPSTTLVLRTCADPEMGPEYAYYAPSVGIDPTRADLQQTKQLQVLELLIRTGSEEVDRIAGSLLARADLHSTFLVLQKMRGLRSEPRYRRAVALARERHGGRIDQIVPALEEDQRRSWIFELRRVVNDAELRFFLALLLNLSDRDAIEDLIRSRYPQTDPLARIEEWIAGLAATGAIGLSLDASLRQLLRAALEGKSSEEILQQLRRQRSPKEIDPQADAIREALRRMTNHPILQPLFRVS